MIIYDWTGIECKALRGAMHMSVEQFADALKIGQRTIEAWEAQGQQRSCARPASRYWIRRRIRSSPVSRER
jgi:DNA-binding transcriptional regulator YiaG